MDATKARELFARGQSIWYDNMSRALLKDGTIENLIQSGAIYGITTNPAIFAKALPASVYDPSIAELATKGFDTRQIYDALTVYDVRKACDMFRQLYERTGYADGYVSLEVNPDLAHDTEGTIRDVKRLALFVDRPNVMFKIPGTPAGVPAIEELVGEGFCINVTLLFDVTHYEAVAMAYKRGLAKFLQSGGRGSIVNSVASLFVSRTDAHVDKLLDAMKTPAASELRGKAGVAVMRECYARFSELFSDAEWGKLKVAGCRPQRVLWASTGTKDPAYKPTKYVDELVAPQTVNTVPPATLDALLKDASTSVAFCNAPDFSELAKLAKLGIDIRAVCSELQEAGIKAFQDSFRDILATLEAKAQDLRGKA